MKVIFLLENDTVRSLLLLVVCSAERFGNSPELDGERAWAEAEAGKNSRNTQLVPVAVLTAIHVCYCFFQHNLWIIPRMKGSAEVNVSFATSLTSIMRPQYN